MTQSCGRGKDGLGVRGVGVKGLGFHHSPVRETWRSRNRDGFAPRGNTDWGQKPRVRIPGARSI